MRSFGDVEVVMGGTVRAVDGCAVLDYRLLLLPLLRLGRTYASYRLRWRRSRGGRDHHGRGHGHGRPSDHGPGRYEHLSARTVM